MNGVKGIGASKGAAIIAAWLHAFVLLAALVLVPADPLFKSYENAATMALTDEAPEEPVERASPSGGDPDLIVLAAEDRVFLRMGESLCHTHEAPRASRCGEAFHARGPPDAHA